MLGRLGGPSGAPRTLALAQLANSVGDGAYYVCSALYFTMVVGLSVPQVGLGLTVAWALGAGAGVVVGWLADRRGPRELAVLLSCLTAVAIGLYLLVQAVWQFMVVACLYAICQCGLAACRQALLAGLVRPRSRTRARAHVQVLGNAGLSLGAALGGVALYLGTPEGYVAVLLLDAGSFLVAAAVLLRVPRVPAVPRVGVAPTPAVVRDRPYVLLTVLNAVHLLNMPLLSVVLPLWVVAHTTAPHWLVSVLLVVNMLGVVLFQVRVAGRVTGPVTAYRSVRVAGVLLLAACCAYALSASGSAPVAALVLLVAAALQVAGEMVQAAGAWELGFELAAPGKQGQYQGFYGMGAAVARMVGPLLLTTLILGATTMGWLALGVLFLSAALATTPAARWALRTRGKGPLWSSSGSGFP